jgi:hypothetical protein
MEILIVLMISLAVFTLWLAVKRAFGGRIRRF